MAGVCQMWPLPRHFLLSVFKSVDKHGPITCSEMIQQCCIKTPFAETSIPMNFNMKYIKCASFTNLALSASNCFDEAWTYLSTIFIYTHCKSKCAKTSRELASKGPRISPAAFCFLHAVPHLLPSAEWAGEDCSAPGHCFITPFLKDSISYNL